MEIKITMLGTSGSSPTRTRSMPGVALSYNGIVLLFDCGEGAQMQPPQPLSMLSASSPAPDSLQLLNKMIHV